MPGEIEILLRVLDQAYDKKSWHGSTLRGALRRITPKEAVWRPSPERHNIQELVVHAAYWKYRAARSIRGEGGRGSFPLKGSDWFERPGDADPDLWEQDLRLLDEMHAALREAVAAIDPKKLGRKAPRSEWTYQQLATGAAAHDLYHTGQMQLLRRLQRE
ncbi:MAG TPA: DinB family protein [Thermoanaerobaculia bacterium]|nr:DinB family protein [Thermoanaerobaculia bacterium]